MSVQSYPSNAITTTPIHPKKQTFNIKDLATESVILYPTKAHVTRQIKDVHLSPNTTHEVVILGLSPTVDEYSIRCEGQGNGNGVTVMDMSVQLVPNRELFEAGDEGSDEDEDDDDDPDEGGDEWKNDAVKALEEELDELAWQLTAANEVVKSSEDRLKTWDEFNKTVDARQWDPSQISENVVLYGQHRAKIFEAQLGATKKIAQLEKAIEIKEREVEKAGRRARKQREKLEKRKRKEWSRKQWKKWDKMKETEYVKNERLRYWPKKVYKVTLLLESASLDSANSSRRNSVGSVTLASTQQVATKEDNVGKSDSAYPSSASLVLSYVTIEAGWTPRYDLSISSVTKTATITYRTEYLNRTSETWRDTKVAFSTSQTSYQGLDDVVPFLHSWRIKLSRYESGEMGLLSVEEKSRSDRPKAVTFNRADVFGRDDTLSFNMQQATAVKEQKASEEFSAGGHEVVSRQVMAQRAPATNAARPKKKEIIYLNGPKAGARELAMGRSSKAARGSLMLRGLEKVKLHRSASGREQPPTYYSSHEGDLIEYSDEEIQVENEEKKEAELLNFETSAWEDNGLTATYDVPGTRTLEPSSQSRRHKIASLHASNIHLSHVCVPKLRSATFLRAKIRNPSSSVTLLKGSAGVTLDGSFLGNMNLPRVSPGEVFDVSLGVDPAIHVNYPKPSVHRSMQGIVFNKESAQVFSRSIWLDNTRSEPVEILVLDQVPVSEDERLRVGITIPNGLMNEGDSVDAGEAAKQPITKAGSSNKTAAWGTAVAKLQKGGEVAWTVKLDGGKGVLLKLQYEARLPPGEKIVPS